MPTPLLTIIIYLYNFMHVAIYRRTKFIHKQSHAHRKLASMGTSMIQIVLAIISFHGFSLIVAYFQIIDVQPMDIDK